MLCLLMGLGVFTAMCAVAKAITLKAFWSRDFTWNEVVVVKWACAEQALSLILVSLPILRPFFRSFFSLPESDPSSSKIPKSNRKFHRNAAPDYSLFKSTNKSNSLLKGKDAPCARIRDEYPNNKLHQLPLAVYRVQRPVERVKYDDLESGQWIGP